MALLVGMSASGLDLESAYGATMATLANSGPGLGQTAYSFSTVNDMAIWLGTLGMILGRLEVFSLLVLLTPQFWRE